jgi:hypothetical protein
MQLQLLCIRHICVQQAAREGKSTTGLIVAVWVLRQFTGPQLSMVLRSTGIEEPVHDWLSCLATPQYTHHSWKLHHPTTFEIPLSMQGAAGRRHRRVCCVQECTVKTAANNQQHHQGGSPDSCCSRGTGTRVAAGMAAADAASVNTSSHGPGMAATGPATRRLHHATYVTQHRR